MKIETLAIGDELLTGKIADTNSAFVADLLFSHGHRLENISVIADTIQALHEKMRECAKRADVVICFGGLGPTSDDKTAEAVAKLIQVKVVQHEASKERLLKFYRSRNREVIPATLKQVLYPEGTDPLKNSVGLAPGFHLVFEATNFYFLPGVPQEMKAMFQNEVLPQIKGEEMLSHQWKCLGVWESELQQLMDPIEAVLPTNAYLGYRTRFPENHLTLYWKGQDEAKFEGWVRKIREILEPFTYTEEKAEIESLILHRLREKNLKVAFAESCTGGLAVHRLTQIAGASDFVWGGVIAYRIEAKKKLLGISVDSIEEAVSADVAREMAESVKRVSGCEIGAAITGFMGPDSGTPENPAGTIYLCVSGKEKIEKKHQLAIRERSQTQWGAATYLLAALYQLLE